jgi:hypothetical protein
VAVETMTTIDYKIPKLEVKTEIFTDHTGTRPEEYFLFLSEYSRYRKGPETIFEFLNKGKAFIPLKHVPTGRFIALNVNEIIYLKEVSETRTPPSVKKVKLYLKNDLDLTVDHFKPLPDSQSRVLDYLNDKNQFIVFFHDGCKIFINKEKVLKVEES